MQLFKIQKSHAVRRGQSLIGILVSVFVMIGMAVFFLMPRGTNEEGERQKSTLKRSMDKAEETGMNSNIQQINMAIMMFKDNNDGKPPASLEELKKSVYGRDIMPEMWINPVDKKPLLYDAATGTICAQGPGCPPSGAPVSAPVAPGANPPAPGAAPAAPAANPASPRGPLGVGKIPQPGAGAADAMNDN